MVKELGAKWVVSKPIRYSRQVPALRNGADEVVYPDRIWRKNCRLPSSANHVFDYIELTDEFRIYEIPSRCASGWESIRE